MELTDVWFALIAVLWIGYFVLEGFDFGVGMLLHVLGRGEGERHAMVSTIGPVWDGNEVWLLVAGGATFAAFPEWYASLFSGLYLPLLLILVALIARGVAIEYRNKRDDAAWRRRWDLAIAGGSAVPALLWGVAFANIVRGVELDADGVVRSSLFDLLNPYGLLGGITTFTVFAAHGAVFVALRTTGELRVRAAALAVRIGAVAVVAAGSFLLWTQLAHGTALTAVTAAVAAVALVGGLAAAWRGREGWAFTGTAAAIALTTVTLFAALYPDVLPSTLDPAWSLTTTNAASSAYTLTIMTWVAAILTPVVLAYQAWSFWVFRARVSAPAVATPDPARASA